MNDLPAFSLVKERKPIGHNALDSVTNEAWMLCNPLAELPIFHQSNNSTDLLRRRVYLAAHTVNVIQYQKVTLKNSKAMKLKHPLKTGRRWYKWLALGIGCAFACVATASTSDAVIDLGRTLFNEDALSADGHVGCHSCHDPAHAFADPRPRGIGTDGHMGTRHAPSLLNAVEVSTFFWDGRRTRLDDVVMDPFTNDVEFGLPSLAVLLDRVRSDRHLVAEFRRAFPRSADAPTVEQVQTALISYLRSLPTRSSAYDRYETQGIDLPPLAEQGRRLFEGTVGCSECHRSGKTASFTDGQFHHSGIGQAAVADRLPAITQDVVRHSLDADALGTKVLKDADWSALGRFVVSHQPVDIGAFRTPSLRNVAVTGPYMHDGSIATLTDAVDHEIYYRGFSRGHSINLSLAERKALVAFLESLTDQLQNSEPAAP